MKRGRKITGGRYKKSRKKRLREQKGQPRIVKLGEGKGKTLRIRGGKRKSVVMRSNVINILTKKGEVKKAKILKILETPSNKFLARQNILTNGTIVETDQGKVRITNRPSQEGVINGVLIK